MAAIRVKSHAIISTLDLNIYANKCILRKNPNTKIYMKEREREKNQAPTKYIHFAKHWLKYLTLVNSLK